MFKIKDAMSIRGIEAMLRDAGIPEQDFEKEIEVLREMDLVIEDEEVSANIDWTDPNQNPLIA